MHKNTFAQIFSLNFVSLAKYSFNDLIVKRMWHLHSLTCLWKQRMMHANCWALSKVLSSIRIRTSETVVYNPLGEMQIEVVLLTSILYRIRCRWPYMYSISNLSNRLGDQTNDWTMQRKEAETRTHTAGRWER